MRFHPFQSTLGCIPINKEYADFTVKRMLSASNQSTRSVARELLFTVILASFSSIVDDSLSPKDSHLHPPTSLQYEATVRSRSSFVISLKPCISYIYESCCNDLFFWDFLEISY